MHQSGPAPYYYLLTTARLHPEIVLQSNKHRSTLSQRLLERGVLAGLPAGPCQGRARTHCRAASLQPGCPTADASPKAALTLSIGSPIACQIKWPGDDGDGVEGQEVPPSPLRPVHHAGRKVSEGNSVLIVVLDEAKTAGPEYARYVVDVRPSTSHASVVNLWSVCDRRTPVIRVHWHLPNCTETPAGCKW